MGFTLLIPDLNNSCTAKTPGNTKVFGKALIMMNLAMFLLKICAKLNFKLKNEKTSIFAPLPNALCIP
jgi:hypothetical protein